MAHFGQYNNNPIGAYYNIGTDMWQVENRNFEDLPLNAQFNVLYQEPSANAYVHTAETVNTSGHITYINHPLLNDSPCAQFQVTPVGFSTNPHPIGVYYTNSTWAIFNQDIEDIKIGNDFYIIVSAERLQNAAT